MPGRIGIRETRSTGWLRAALLGANDGLISTSSLIVGVVAAQATREPVLVVGVAGLVAGMLSMAAGEYVSVSSQADTEEAELALERESLARRPELEKAELAEIYVSRGLTPALADEVAAQLMAHDPLGAHARDDLEISERMRARPLQAAAASGLSFASGALPPLLLLGLVPYEQITRVMIASTPLLLAALGAIAARLGRAPVWRGALRVAFWGVAALVCSSLVGQWFGAE